MCYTTSRTPHNHNVVVGSAGRCVAHRDRGSACDSVSIKELDGGGGATRQRDSSLFSHERDTIEDD